MAPDKRLPERSKEVRAVSLPNSDDTVPEMPLPSELERSRPVTLLPETVTPLQELIAVWSPMPQVFSG